MNNLIIDFGNTYKKIALERNGNIFFTHSYVDFSINEIQELEKEYSFQRVIMSSVLTADRELENYLKAKCFFIKVSHKTFLPIANQYETPKTLGTDRLACVVAAHQLYPKSDCLVVQMGSCITYDFINQKGEYKGGSISPGLQMRYKALHAFTKKLPHLKSQTIEGIIGKTTQESIHIGVNNGIIQEANGVINQYENKYKFLKVLVTGGDSPMFEDKFQHKIILQPNLVTLGLSAILTYNNNERNS